MRAPARRGWPFWPARFVGPLLSARLRESLLLDVMLTGLSILLEFWALVALRVREPDLARPFRVPGGLAGAIFLGLPPLGLMIAAAIRNHGEKIGSVSGLSVGIVLIAIGPILYFATRGRAARNAAQ